MPLPARLNRTGTRGGLPILGDRYVCDKMSYVLQDTSPDYVAKYMIRVG